MVFEGLCGSLRVAGFAESCTITVGLLGSVRVFPFAFAEGLSGSLELVSISATQSLSVTDRLYRFLVVFPFSLSGSFPKLCDLQRPTKKDYMETRLHCRNFVKIAIILNS